MPPNEPRHASLHGQALERSGYLRQGLVQSLHLMGVFGERALANVDGRALAERVIGDLLRDAPGEHWCTLERLLPVLAEASPDSFLSAVERSLVRSQRFRRRS